MTILKVFESMFTETRFENSITAPTKRLRLKSWRRTSYSDKEDDKVCASPRMDAHSSLASIFVLIQS
jgi:hypothetical protein